MNWRELAGWIGSGIVGLIINELWAENRRRRQHRWFEPVERRWARRALAGLTGCAIGVAAIAVVQLGRDEVEDDDAIEVLVVWEEQELEQFRRLVEDYPGADVVVRTGGTKIGERLNESFEDGDPPDVAIIAQPRLVQAYAEDGLLAPVETPVTEQVQGSWNDLVTNEGDDKVYGAWVKGSYKSLFWYRPDRLEGEDPPTWDWNQLTRWVRQHDAGEPAEAPLAMAAQDCWAITDWFENHLAALDPEVYDKLARGEMRDWGDPAVSLALDELGSLWSEQEGGRSFLLGGFAGASRTTWRELPRQVADDRAALAFGPSFLAGRVALLPDDGPDVVRYFPYPAVNGNDPPVVVGGDVAVVPRQPEGGEEKGHDLVRWLTDQVATRRWTELDPGYLTPSDQSPYVVDAGGRNDLRLYLTALLRDPPGGLRFDLTDQFGAVSDGEPAGASQVFYDFLRTVSEDPSLIPEATDEVIERLEAEARGESQIDKGDPCDR